MNGYLIHFATYTFAMIGFIVIILFIYKKTMYSVSSAADKNFLKVESLLKLSPTKTLYVIKAGTERFLIAGDNTNTTMLSKLDENNVYIPEEMIKEKIMDFSSIKETIQKINRG